MSYFSSIFTDPTTTEIYTLSLHDALPIYTLKRVEDLPDEIIDITDIAVIRVSRSSYMFLSHLKFADRKSTRLNSSHVAISYAVFCLKKKKEIKKIQKKLILLMK